MYLSNLLIDVGANPDRPRPGRLWLRNLYRVHQRLCMAFISQERKSRDPEFLQPYSPDDLGQDQVHVARETGAGFLFRVEPHSYGRVVILVQSAAGPDWEYAFHNAGHFLAAPPQSKQYEPSFVEGQRLRFRLVANPTRRIDTKTQMDGKRRHGKRVPVPSATEIENWRRENANGDPCPFIRSTLYGWLARQGEGMGFSVEEDNVEVQPGYIYMNKQRDSRGQRLRSARYDGLLTVTNPEDFLKAIVKGIGPGKAFGFGLLSAIPVGAPSHFRLHANPRPPRSAEVS